MRSARRPWNLSRGGENKWEKIEQERRSESACWHVLGLPHLDMYTRKTMLPYSSLACSLCAIDLTSPQRCVFLFFSRVDVPLFIVTVLLSSALRMCVDFCSGAHHMCVRLCLSLCVCARGDACVPLRRRCRLPRPPLQWPHRSPHVSFSDALSLCPVPQPALPPLLTCFTPKDARPPSIDIECGTPLFTKGEGGRAAANEKGRGVVGAAPHCER